jgi:hypothetical protein
MRHDIRIELRKVSTELDQAVKHEPGEPGDATAIVLFQSPMGRGLQAVLG